MQVASIRAALKEVFPEVLILTAPTTILTASRVRLPSSEAPLIRRLQERGIKTRLVSPYYLRYLFTNDRNLQARAVLAGAKAPANTDLRPLCYLLETQLWLSRFFPSLGAAEVAPKAASLWPLLLVTGLLFLASRLREGLRRWLLVAAAAFAGTLLEALLLMAHQAACGSLYQDLAVLMMAFMAGLALGASITNAIMAGRARKRRILGFVLTAALVLLGGATWARVRGLLPAGLAVSSSLILASGFLVAAMLAYASLRGVRDQGTVIAPLYAADLLGGCLGMLSGGLFAIPLLGLDGSSLAVTGLAGLCLLLL
jgi:spermidine synthase